MTNNKQLICYCFNYTKEQVLDAINNGDEQEIIQSIKSQMKNLGCMCTKRNPKGVCCLDDIKLFIEHNKITH